MKMVIDTNIIIRLLTGDDLEQSPIARAFISKVEENDIQLIVYPLVVSECVYVLKNRYGYEKKQITEALFNLFEVDCIEVEETVKDALQSYEKWNVDIVDALIASQASDQGFTVITWNKKHFKRFDCNFCTPEDILST